VPLADATKWFMEMMAGWVKDLASVKEIDGSSLLDNMVITLCSDVSEYHKHDNAPYLVFGGAKLGIKGGRCLRYPAGSTNDVFASLAKPFQVNLPDGKFGDPKQGQGPLAELVT
jgi:hypothetical protein